MTTPKSFSPLINEEIIILAKELRSLRDFEDGIFENNYLLEVFLGELKRVLSDHRISLNVRGGIAKWYERFTPARLWILSNAPTKVLSSALGAEGLVSKDEVKAFLSNPAAMSKINTPDVKTPVSLVAYAITGPGQTDDEYSWGMNFQLRDYLCRILINKKVNVLEIAHDVFEIIASSETVSWTPTVLLGWIRRTYELESLPDSFIHEFLKTLIGIPVLETENRIHG